MKSSRALMLTVGSVLCGQAFAALTADQIIEKNIAATGGRSAYMSQKSVVMTGSVEVTAQGLKGSIVTYQKDPDKLLVVMTIPGIGDVKQGYDGNVAWAQDRMTGLRKLSGDEKASFVRQANGSPLRWHDLYPVIKLVGRVKVGERDAYKLKFIPKQGDPVVQYFDVTTFLVLRADAVEKSAQGTFAVQSYLSDYRVVAGLKMPFKTVMKTPVGEMVVKLSKVQTNKPVDDAQFACPPETTGPGK